MKKLLFALLFCIGAAHAASVTATVTDSDGQTWNNATWTAALVSPNGLPTISGVALTAAQQAGAGQLSNGGVLTATLVGTDTLDQTGAYWNFTLCPNASYRCVTIATTAVVGASPNLTSALSTGLAGPRFIAGVNSYGYNNNEVFPTPTVGALYYNTTSYTICQLNFTGWVCGGGGGAVSSVNGQTGVVVLGASNVNAVPLNGTTPMTGNLQTPGIQGTNGTYSFGIIGAALGTSGDGTLGTCASNVGNFGISSALGAYFGLCEGSTFLPAARVPQVAAANGPLTLSGGAKVAPVTPPGTPGTYVETYTDSGTAWTGQTPQLFTPAGIGAEPNGTTTNALLPLGYRPQVNIYGDSNSGGHDLYSGYYGTHSFYWVDAVKGSIHDYAFTGGTSNQQDSVIFNYPPLCPNGGIEETIGTNNVLLGGASAAQQQIYGQNILGQYLFDATYCSPTHPPLLVNTSSAFTRPGGTWNHSTLFGANSPGQNCTGTSCGLQFPTVGPYLFVETGASNGNTATATLTCDGTATGATLYFQGVSATNFLNVPQATQTTAVTLSGGATTPHSCTINGTSAGTIDIEAIYSLPGTPVTDGSWVIAGGIFDQTPVNTNTAAYVSQQTADVTLLNTAGLTQIGFANMTGTTPVGCYADGAVHLNEYCQWLAAANVYLPELNTLLSTHAAMATTTYPGTLVINTATNGAGNLYLNSNDISNSNNAGSFNLFISNGAGVGCTNCNSDVFAGQSSGTHATTAGYDDGYGVNTLENCTTCTNDDAGGADNMQNVTTASYNTNRGVAGFAALTTGNSNDGDGYDNCDLATTILFGVCHGAYSGTAAATGAVGITTDSDFVLDGGEAGKSVATILTNFTALGWQALASASNQFTLGNGNVTSLVVHGALHLNGVAPTANAGNAPVGTNNAGYISGLSAASSVTLTFATANPWATFASCTANPSASLTSPIEINAGVVSATFTFTAPFTGTMYYHCDGN